MRAALFPGQGVPTPNLLAALRGEPDDLVDNASRTLGYDLLGRVSDAARRPKRALPTTLAQPAILVAGLAGWNRLSREGLRFDFVAGHSLGEYSALVAAGSLTFEDALRVVEVRGRSMQVAAARSPGGMCAVLGLDVTTIESIATSAGAEIANENAPDQTVLSGSDVALAEAARLAKAAGGRPILLDVAGPFHHPAMREVVPELRDALDHASVRSPRVPVISNVTARPYSSPGEIRRRLCEQVSGRVRFRQTLEWLWDQGVRHAIDTGPGRVVAGLAKRTLPQLVTQEAEAVGA